MFRLFSLFFILTVLLLDHSTWCEAKTAVRSTTAKQRKKLKKGTYQSNPKYDIGVSMISDAMKSKMKSDIASQGKNIAKNDAGSVPTVEEVLLSRFGKSTGDSKRDRQILKRLTNDASSSKFNTKRKQKKK
jgi:hypothetical protein